MNISNKNSVTSICPVCHEDLNISYDKKNSYLKLHEECVFCASCEEPLMKKGWCVVRKGALYCDLDCLTIQRQPKDGHCHTCFERLNGNSRVLKLRGYIHHLKCLKCSDCGVKLKPGRPYGIKKEKIVCSQHDSESFKNKKQFSRTLITEKKKLLLLAKFQHKKYPNSEERIKIGKELKLPVEVIKVWFQNQRSRAKSYPKKRKNDDMNEDQDDSEDDNEDDNEDDYEYEDESEFEYEEENEDEDDE